MTLADSNDFVSDPNSLAKSITNTLQDSYDNNRARFKEEEYEGIYRPYGVYVNREVREDVINTMHQTVLRLHQDNYTARICPIGDFEKTKQVVSSDIKQELHIPFKGFNQLESKFSFTPAKAKELAKTFTPGFDSLKAGFQLMLGVIPKLVLGKDMKSRSEFIIVFSEDGVELGKEKTARTGIAGLAIAIAAAVNIPVFNYYHNDAEQRLFRFLGLNQ
jgi:hypothetical protein